MVNEIILYYDARSIKHQITSNTSHCTIACILVKGIISPFYFERAITSLRNLQIRCGNHTASQSIGILVLSQWVKRPRRDNNTHHRLAARLRMSGAILLLPTYAFMDKYTFNLYHHYVCIRPATVASRIFLNFLYNRIHNLRNSIKKRLSVTFFQFISASYDGQPSRPRVTPRLLAYFLSLFLD